MCLVKISRAYTNILYFFLGISNVVLLGAKNTIFVHLNNKYVFSDKYKYSDVLTVL